MTISRTKFIQAALHTSYDDAMKINYFDLIFYWMFYKSEGWKESRLENLESKQIFNALQIIPRSVQIKLIMKILAEPEIDHSKKVKAVVKLYS